MKTRRYFVEQVLRKRPYLDPDWCNAVLAAPIRREVQEDGRVRFWGAVTDPLDGRRRILRVLTRDRDAVHDAFLDRDFREDAR